MTRAFIDSIRAEYLRHQALAEAAIRQLSDAQLCAPAPGGGNPIAVICWHLAGNLQSRFTDFLTTDGEKPWRQREDEFAARTVARPELLAKWTRGWSVLLATLADLRDEQLHQSVVIRGQSLTVHAALHRSLAHAAYHTGQIVYVAKALLGPDWRYLSIPPGGSDAYNRAPAIEQAAAHQRALAGSQPAFAFGDCQVGIDYQLRPGAYAILRDGSGRIAVVREAGRSFLPGGGQDTGETLEQTLHREVQEETGLRLRIEQCVGTVDQYVQSSGDGVHYQKRCTFYVATALGAVDGAAPEHEVEWLELSAAAPRLHYGSQRWALATAADPLPR